MPHINDAFPSKYLKASDLKGRTVSVTIDRVEFEAVGQSREMKPVVYFAGKEKGMVLNKTNANKIMQLLESPVTEEWQGGQIAIYPTETTFAGDTVECVRVKAVQKNGRHAAPPPSPKPEPITDDREVDYEDDGSVPF